MFYLRASELCIAQGPVIPGRLQHYPLQELVLPIPNMLPDLLPFMGLPLLTQGPSNTSILSPDVFVSGIYSQQP